MHSHRSLSLRVMHADLCTGLTHAHSATIDCQVDSIIALALFPQGRASLITTCACITFHIMHNHELHILKSIHFCTMHIAFIACIVQARSWCLFVLYAGCPLGREAPHHDSGALRTVLPPRAGC